MTRRHEKVAVVVAALGHMVTAVPPDLEGKGVHRQVNSCALSCTLFKVKAAEADLSLSGKCHQRC